MEFEETSESKIESLVRVFSERVVLHSFALSCYVNALIESVDFDIHNSSRYLRFFTLI